MTGQEALFSRAETYYASPRALRGRHRRSRRWLLPAATFVAGAAMALGFVSLMSPAPAVAFPDKLAVPAVRTAASSPSLLLHEMASYRQRSAYAAGHLVPKPKPRARPAARRSPSVQSTSYGYANPLRALSGLSFGRVDAGVDYGGSGPVYADGPGVIVSTYNDGWGPANGGASPGGWICYELTAGPDAGNYVYIAEGVTAESQVTEKVTASTVIAYADGNGIETGWAAPGCGGSALDPYAGYPTAAGSSYASLLASLGTATAGKVTRQAGAPVVVLTDYVRHHPDFNPPPGHAPVKSIEAFGWAKGHESGCWYYYGGTGCSPGYDCSGAVMMAYKAVGISMQRTVAEMAAHNLIQIREDQAHRGDVVVWGYPGQEFHIEFVAYAHDGTVRYTFGAHDSGTRVGTVRLWTGAYHRFFMVKGAGS